MKELVVVLAKAIVDQPEAVSVAEHEEEDGTLILELSVSPDDVGKVIGRQGRVIKAIRMVAKAAAAKEGRKVAVEVV